MSIKMIRGALLDVVGGGAIDKEYLYFCLNECGFSSSSEWFDKCFNHYNNGTDLLLTPPTYNSASFGKRYYVIDHFGVCLRYFARSSTFRQAMQACMSGISCGESGLPYSTTVDALLLAS